MKPETTNVVETEPTISTYKVSTQPKLFQVVQNTVPAKKLIYY